MAKEDSRRDGEGFLSGWSRRKRAAARAEAETEAQAAEAEDHVEEGLPEAEPAPDPIAEAEPEITEEELAALPPLDEITGETDLTPFQKRGVPAALRKAAMRKVWLGKSLIRDHDDPAVDYAWDWNAPEAVPGAGGALSQDRVSKMVDDLMKHDRPDPKSDAVEDDTPDHATQAPDAGVEPVTDDPADPIETPAQDSDPNLAQDPVRRAGQPGPERATQPPAPSSATDQPAADAGAEAGDPIPPRRHGGALPE